MPETHQLSHREKICLADLPTEGTTFHDDRDAAEREFDSLRNELVELQLRLYAENRRKLLIILQAIDTGGKDSTIRHVFGGVNPQGVVVHSFKSPTEEELAHDFLWRVHKRVPATGMIGIFNRSHYEDVLIVRVDKLVDQDVWRARYEMINNFESLLAGTGTTILKFFLHVSRKEQKKRLQDRLDTPHKNWKFSSDDLHKREKWDKYQLAFEEMLNRCTTPFAPWYVIPADQKWYRNLAVARVVVNTLKKLNPKYPPPEPGLDRIVIPD